MFEKRGDLTAGQIVAIVLIIAGFIVLILFIPSLVKIFGTGESSREICHLSVIARASTPLGESLIPLKCAAEKVCISESGRDDACKEFAGIKNVREVKLKGNEEEKARIIEKELADSMLFCWYMLGEGKLDLFRKVSDIQLIPSFDEVKPKCVVCSRIAIADDVPQNVRDKVDVNEYMAYERPSEIVEYTYLQLMTDVGITVPPKNEISDGAGSLQNQIGILFSQIKIQKGVFEAAGGTAVTSFVAYKSLSIVPFLGKITSSKQGKVFGVIASVVAGGLSGAVTYQGQINAIGHCQDFVETKELQSKGCSVVRAIEWTEENIDKLNNKYCAGDREGSL